MFQSVSTLHLLFFFCDIYIVYYATHLDVWSAISFHFAMNGEPQERRKFEYIFVVKSALWVQNSADS